VQTTIRELCDAILRLKHSPLQVVYKPYSEDDARQFVKNRIGSRRKAERDLGFRYTCTLEQGLQKLIDWRMAAGIDRAAAAV
jgi:UDP-glucose 4-epimerase